MDTSGGSLYIVRSTRDNAGVYVCIGSNQAGTDRESVEVVVRPRGGEPLIIGNLPDKVDAPLNQRVELTCMVGADNSCAINRKFSDLYMPSS